MDGRAARLFARHPSEHLRWPGVTEGSKMRTITLTLFVLMLSNVAKAQNPDPSKGVLDTAGICEDGWCFGHRGMA